MARACPILDVPVAIRQGNEGPERVPGCIDALEQLQVSWFQIADLGDRLVIGLKCEAGPQEIVQAPGVVECAAETLDFDQLITPFVADTDGHFSYAHTAEYASEDFNTSYDPFGNSPNWTNLENDVWRSSGGKLVVKTAGTYHSKYRFDSADMSAVSPDYSADAVCVCTYINNFIREVCPAGRMQDANNLYYAQLRDTATDNFKIKKVSGGVISTLAATTVASPDGGLVRLEIVGSTLKAYYKGAEEISTSDDGITNAGYAGIKCFQESAGSGDASIDDFKVYIEERGRPARLIGPLAARAQLGFGLAT